VAVAAGVLAVGVAPVAFGYPVAAACPAASASLTGTGTASDPYLVGSTADLMHLSTTSSLWNSDHFFRQTADIDLDGCTWTPIGDGTTKFTGTYDGGGNAITNLDLVVTSIRVGLFGYVERATFTSMELSGFNIDVSSDSTFSGAQVGALFGLGQTVTIDDVGLSESVIESVGNTVGGLGGELETNGTTASSTMTDVRVGPSVRVTGNNKVGGVIGLAERGGPASILPALVARDVQVTADVEGGYSVGGAIGSFEPADGNVDNELTAFRVAGSVTGESRVGGLFGELWVRKNVAGTNASEMLVADAVSTASVEGSAEYVGGAVGYLFSNSNIGFLTLDRVGAFGDVTGTGATGASFGVGGLVGFIDNYSGNVRITESFAIGGVSGTQYGVGGLIGKVVGRTSGSPSVDIRVSDSYASGSVSASDAAALINSGGLIGQVDLDDTNSGTADHELVISDSYASGAVVSGTDNGGLIGKVHNPLVTVTDSFWDSDSSGQAASAAGTGKTTADMTAFSTFDTAGWSISDGGTDETEIWGTCGSRPFLMWAASLVASCIPGAPSGVVVSGVDGTASVSWTAASVVGVDPVASYTVTAAPGGASCTATAPAVTCDVTGLSAGTSYTFSVTATNTVGTGPAAVSAAFAMTATPAPTTVAPTTTLAVSPTQALVVVTDSELPAVDVVSGATEADLGVPGTVVAGQTVTATGTGFTPEEGVVAFLASTRSIAATSKVSSAGVATASVMIPVDASGEQTIVMWEPASDRLLAQTVTVEGAVLPATGGSFPVAPVMVLLLAAGAVLVVTARRRSVV
jgi:hypothetical protein